MRWRRIKQPFFSNRPPAFDPTTGSVKNGEDKLLLEQSVSLAGSIWLRSVEDSLGITQTLNGPHGYGLSQSLSISHAASASVDRYASASSTLSLVHANSVAGGRTDSGGGGGAETVEAIFDSNTSPGMVIYVSSNGHVDLAKADTFATSIPVGISLGAVLADGTGDYVTGGPVTLEDWTPVVGSQFLEPGKIYFLSVDDAGQMRITTSEVSGTYVVIIGTALTQTTFNIEIHRALVNG